jgi:hypothetical protein
LAFSADGKTLISGGDDEVVLSWELDPDKWLSVAKGITNVP